MTMTLREAELETACYLTEMAKDDRDAAYAAGWMDDDSEDGRI